MKSFCLLNKKTGDLFQGYRISLYDNNSEGDVLTRFGAIYSISVKELRHDGWIIFHPKMGDNPLFFNRHCEKWFTNLGEI